MGDPLHHVIPDFMPIQNKERGLFSDEFSDRNSMMKNIAFYTWMWVRGYIPTCSYSYS